MKKTILFVLSFFVGVSSWAQLSMPLLGKMDRRRPAYSTDFAYFVYPIAGSVPGLGTAYGAGGTLVNLAETDIDITGFSIRGDFEASGIAFLNIHLIPQTLVLDFGRYSARVAPKQFKRGIDSKLNDFILPKVAGDYVVGQITATGFDRQLEGFFRYLTGDFRIEKVLDKDGNSFPNMDDQKVGVKGYTSGATLDLTDDRQDPRNGNRIETALYWSPKTDDLLTQFKTLDLNYTSYFPMRGHDTLVFNVFQSQAIIDKKATTDEAELRAKIGLGCAGMPDSPAKTSCLAAENQVVQERIDYNTYGEATFIGGVQRLRSFQNGRYHAGNSLSYGAEYRWNITDERTLMDIYIMRGIRTGIQAAFFLEQGTVSDNPARLWTAPKKTTVGTGFRLIFSGVTVRADLGFGDEGSEMQIFLDYPWSLFSVDKP